MYILHCIFINNIIILIIIIIITSRLFEYDILKKKNNFLLSNIKRFCSLIVTVKNILLYLKSSLSGS